MDTSSMLKPMQTFCICTKFNHHCNRLFEHSTRIAGWITEKTGWRTFISQTINFNQNYFYLVPDSSVDFCGKWHSKQDNFPHSTSIKKSISIDGLNNILIHTLEGTSYCICEEMHAINSFSFHFYHHLFFFLGLPDPKFSTLIPLSTE